MHMKNYIAKLLPAAALILHVMLYGCSMPCLQQVPVTGTYTFRFPCWPPEEFKGPCPQLVKWRLEITGCGIHKELLVAPGEPAVSIELPQNEPASILAYPVTATGCASVPYNSTSTEEFFRPCGAIIPDNSEGKHHELSWQAGFSSHLLACILNRHSYSDSNYVIPALFNWNKLQETIAAKESDSVPKVSSSKCFFSPWRINEEILINAIESGSFKATQIKQLESKNFMISEYIPEIGTSFLYPEYIPEAAVIQSTGFTAVQKNDYMQTDFLAFSESSELKIHARYTSAKKFEITTEKYRQP